MFRLDPAATLLRRDRSATMRVSHFTTPDVHTGCVSRPRAEADAWPYLVSGSLCRPRPFRPACQPGCTQSRYLACLDSARPGSGLPRPVPERLPHPGSSQNSHWHFLQFPVMFEVLWDLGTSTSPGWHLFPRSHPSAKGRTTHRLHRPPTPTCCACNTGCDRLPGRPPAPVLAFNFRAHSTRCRSCRRTSNPYRSLAGPPSPENHAPGAGSGF